MKTERVIQLLEIEKQYRLKQTGHSQQPINKEVAEALDIAIEAVKKQILKKPRHIDYDYSYFVCDSCGATIFYSDDADTHNHCLHCGQALDWGQEE